MSGRPQTAIDKFFTPFVALAVVADQDVSADAQFEGQNWQNLCFVFKGLTAARTLTLPTQPIVGMSVTTIDGDRSSTSSHTVTLAGNGNSISGPSGSGSTLVAVQSAGGATSVVFESTGWRVSDAITSGATGAGVTSTGVVTGTNVYGDGSDGTATCDGTTSVSGMALSGGRYTLTRDCYFANLTITVGVSVDGGGFRLFVRDTLLNNGHFGVDGGDAAGGTTTGTPGVGGGGDLSGTKRLGGGYPGDGGITANALGGYGSCGDGAFGTPGGTNAAVPPDAALGGWRDLTTMSGWLMGPGLNPGVVILKGGAGGIEGSHNGTCCGGGGGVGIILARILQGNGSFTSRGGQGAVCTSYPLLGGNGGGGFLMLVTRDVTGWTGTTDVSGGPPYGYTGAGPTTYNILAGGAGQVLPVTA